MDRASGDVAMGPATLTRPEESIAPAPARAGMTDAAIAIALALLALVEVWPVALAPLDRWIHVNWAVHVVPIALALGSTLPLAFRRRFPTATLLVVGTVMTAWLVRGGESPSGSFLALFLAIFSAATYSSDRLRGVVAMGFLVVVTAVLWWTGGGFDPWLLFMLAFGVGIWLAGDALRSRTLQARLHERRAGELEGQRAAGLRQAAADERARIARELHDVIAHNLSVVVIQAIAAQRVLDEQPLAAREALRQVEASGRIAMTEMRRLLGVLRRGGDEPLTDPQPGVADLASLAADLGAAGLPVTFRTTGADRPLPPGIDVSVYRIVQEALTNTLRHAGATAATVDVRYLPRAVEVEVIDDGQGASAARWDGDGGYGLAGMRERAALFEGDFDAGPREGGGFRVRVLLPSEPSGSAA
jgi:signal transduction histidine kinase